MTAGYAGWVKYGLVGDDWQYDSVGEDLRRGDVQADQLRGPGITFYCDGKDIGGVLAFDLDEGWAEAMCQGCEYGEGPRHIRGDGACTVRHEGKVTYTYADGRVVS